MPTHISEQFDLELAQINESLIEMGTLVESQVNEACNALLLKDLERAEQVRAAEARVNQIEKDLDDECVAIIAKRQPAASDLRTVVSVMKLITDLERIGDEADRVAKMAIELLNTQLSREQHSGFQNVHTAVFQMLRKALDAFARLDVQSAVQVIEADSKVDAAYTDLMRITVKSMQDNSTDVERDVSVMWAVRSLERIGDHAKNIGEIVIYRVQGLDVRYGPAPGN